MLSPDKIIIGAIAILLVFVGILLFQLFGDDEGKGEQRQIEESEDVRDDTKTVISTIDGQDEVAEEREIGREKLEVPESFRNTGGTGGARGRVVNKDGAPVTGATLTLYLGRNIFFRHPNARQKLNIKAVTSSTGEYFMKGVPAAREFSLTANHGDYADTSYSPLFVQANQVMELPDIIMNSGFVVTGKITDKRGTPIQGALVELFDPNFSAYLEEKDKRPLMQVMSGGGGEYGFDKISFSGFEVKVSAAGYATQIKQAMQWETKRQSEINFELGPGYEVSGVTLGPDKNPLPGVHLVANRANSRKYKSTGTALSGQDGSFTITGLAEGLFAVRGFCDGYTDGRNARVRSGDKDVIVMLRPQGGLAGTVRDQKTGTPVKSYNLTVFRKRRKMAQQKTNIIQQITAEDGQYEVTGLDPGLYSVEIAAKGYANCSSEQVTVSQGEVLPGVDVFMNKGGSVTGKVVSPDGSPIPNVNMQLRFNHYIDMDLFQFFSTVDSDTGDTGKKAVSDSKGIFTKTLIKPGVYQVHLTHPGYTELSINDVTVFADENQSTDLGVLQLKRGGTVKGKTVDHVGRAMPGVMVSLSRKDGFHRQVMSDKDARFAFAHLEPGEYSVTGQSTNANSEDGTNAFAQLFLVEQTKVIVYLEEGEEESIVVQLTSGQ